MNDKALCSVIQLALMFLLSCRSGVTVMTGDRNDVCVCVCVCERVIVSQPDACK